MLLDVDSGNPITSLPANLGNILTLKNLYAWETQLSSLPSSLSNINGLEKLSIAYSQFYEFPNFIQSFSSLNYLWIGGNYLFCENGEISEDLIPEFLIKTSNFPINGLY